MKQPLQTSIAIDTLDFEHFAVEEKLHIGISVKDFKAIITHAETLKTMISAMYSHPTRPLQLSYLAHGMHCQFTLMTIGEYRGGSVTPARVETRENSARPSSRQASGQASERGRSQLDATTMPPPMQPASRTFARDSTQRTARPSPPPPKASVDHESLFLPQDDEDERQWGEKNYDDDEDELGWDASADNVCLFSKSCIGFDLIVYDRIHSPLDYVEALMAMVIRQDRGNPTLIRTQVLDGSHQLRECQR